MFMENLRIDLSCYKNNRLKKQLSIAVCLNLYILCRVERNFRKLNKISLTVFAYLYECKLNLFILIKKKKD